MADQLNAEAYRIEDGKRISNSHDDGNHFGSAKRDVADGLAGLGAGGQLLAPGPDIELTRDGSENIEVVERTSGDIVYRWTRVGANDYECRINCGGVACKMLNDSLINVANGIAGLDAAAKLAQAQMPDLFIQSQTPQILTGAGAVDITSAITFLVTAGVGDALSLVDGVEGQTKLIITKTETTGGDTSILTPDNLRGFSTITFDAVGESINLIFLDGKWSVKFGFKTSVA